MKQIKVGIVDDHTLFRQGIAGLLNNQSGIQVVLEASNGVDLMAKLAKTKKDMPHVLLMDVQMPEMNGIEATKYVSSKYPKIRSIALTMHDNDQMIYHLVENGACGFLAKSADIEVVVDAIFSAHIKGYYLNERVSAIMLKGASRRKSAPSYNIMLSERETEILKLICCEHNNKEIAEIMSLSHRTVEAYKLKIQEKVGARNVVGLVLYAMNNNLLNLKI